METYLSIVANQNLKMACGFLNYLAERKQFAKQFKRIILTVHVEGDHLFGNNLSWYDLIQGLNNKSFIPPIYPESKKINGRSNLWKNAQLKSIYCFKQMLVVKEKQQQYIFLKELASYI